MGIKRIVGTMSGSSLDGLDIVYCEWQGDEYSTLDAEVVDIPNGLRERLMAFDTMTALPLMLLDKDLSIFMGDAINDFLAKTSYGLPDMIVSHGHTLLHHPDRGITWQIGCGATLACKTGVDVLCDLRMHDVALGGQGAPLAALMDTALLQDYLYCLNLGGIANITVNGEAHQSWDLCAVNQVLNHLASLRGMDYDAGGQLAASGQLETGWYDQLGKLPYYQQSPPKSLDNTWVKDCVVDAIPYDDGSVEDLLHTYVHFIVDEIVRQLQSIAPRGQGRMLVTGGGAHNDYLIGLLSERLDSLGIKLVKPSDELVDYKEAILMSYIGARYMDGLSTTVPGATGAGSSVLGGALYKAPL